MFDCVEEICGYNVVISEIELPMADDSMLWSICAYVVIVRVVHALRAHQVAF